MFYILKNRQPIKCDREQWLAWLDDVDDSTMIVEKTFYRLEYERSNIDVEVSTVFLTFAHGSLVKPELFETMIFADGRAGSAVRCQTYDQAEAMHRNACDVIEQQFGEKLTKLDTKTTI